MAGIVTDDRQRLEQEIARKEEKIQKLRTLIRSNEERIKKLEDAEEAEKEKIKALEAENKELGDKIKTLENENKALKEEIDKLKNENESLVKKQEVTNKRIEELEKEKSVLIIIEIGKAIQRNMCKYVLGKHFNEDYYFYKVKDMEKYITEWLKNKAEQDLARERWSELNGMKIWDESLVDSLKDLKEERNEIGHPKLTSENIQQAMECLKECLKEEALEDIRKLKKNWETSESLLRKPEPESANENQVGRKSEIREQLQTALPCKPQDGQSMNEEELRKKEQELQEKEKEIEKLKREKENAQQQAQENKILTARIEELKEEIERLKVEIKKLKEEFENQKEEFENQKEEFENQKEEFENQKEEFENQKEEFENQKEEFENQKEAFENQKEAFENQKEAFENQKEAFEDQKEAFEDQKEEFENQKEEFENQKEEFENQKKEFDNQKKEFENQKKEFENQKEESEKLKVGLEKTEGNLHILRLTAMCNQLQKNFYQIVFDTHDFSKDKQSYNARYIENDIKYGRYGLTTDEKKRQARERWENLKKKLGWETELHVREIKQLKCNRNITVNPEITKDMKESLEHGAKALNNERNLNITTLGFVQDLIDMWFETEDLVQRMEISM